MNEAIGILKNTGLLTIVGIPIFIFSCISKLRGKLPLNWYAFVPFAQAYLLTGVYFAIFGPRIVTSHLQTFLYLFLGSHFLTTALCVTIFLRGPYFRPKRPFPLDLEGLIIRVFGTYAFALALGLGLFFALVVNDHCDGLRCEGALLLAGRFGFTGTLTFSAFWMGVSALWLNFLCYIYLPYVSPEKDVINA